MGDAATLKKRFDDIFASTRYTKALELIKKQRKEYTAEIKELKLKLEHLQTIKDNVNKVRSLSSRSYTAIIITPFVRLRKKLPTLSLKSELLIKRLQN